MTAALNRELTSSEMDRFQRDGFIAIDGLFSPEESASLRDHFMELQAAGPIPGHFEPATNGDYDIDPLKRFPRFIHPHRVDQRSRKAMMDIRLRPILCALLDEEPLAAQSMFYFKPPTARGQALHQDNFYLKVQPGTCMAAWLSLDDADEENGGMFVVPGSHKLDILCPHAADMKKSFTIEEVDVPAGMDVVQVEMKAGDVLFFNGSLIHGSYPNTSRDRFRRAFISHYVPQSLTAMSDGYYPLHSFDGLTITRGTAEGGGICGTEEWALLQGARDEAVSRNEAGVGQGAI